MPEENKKFFISTAIDYPSAKPHLGHCLERVQADVIARYKRLGGFNVHFSIGLDEHGQKIEKCAEKAKKKPQKFVAEIGDYFEDLWRQLHISNDDFVRTTEKRHQKVVEKVIKEIFRKGDIYEGNYKGLYCVDCETYYLPKDLEDGNCPIHHKPAQVIEEETYFFKMAKYQRQIVAHIEKNNDFIVPETRRNEILARLKEPLQDLSISRCAVKWGIPLPIHKDFTLFVWVDALLNYLTTLEYPNEKFKQFWPADVQVVGKDITWHHCVIWPSLLLSLGLPLPKTIFVHGYLTSNGQKMSKSLGNVVDPVELAKKYGTDSVRYFLLREISSTEDGDYTSEKFEERYNADLAKGLGNLVARVAKLAEGKTFDVHFLNPNFQALINETRLKYKRALETFKFNEALAAVWQLISFCDRAIEEERPWESQNHSSVINDLLVALANIAQLLKPFLPETAEKILQQLGAKPNHKEWHFKVKKGKALFPRLDKNS